MSKKTARTASRSWGIIIPGEWESSRQIILKAKSLAKYYYYIEHYKDCYTEDGEFNSAGELKKKHTHLLFTFNSSRELSTVANYFSDFPELRQNSFEKINNITGAKRYLIHADNPEKSQYDIYEVETNDKCFSNCFIEKMASEDEVRIINEKYGIGEARTMEEYINKFMPILVNMNSYQKMIVIRNLRKDWAHLNRDKAFEAKALVFGRGNENENDGLPF